MNIFKFIEDVKRNGGGSYCISTKSTNPSTGYMVSLYGIEKIVSEITIKDINQYFTANIDLLAMPNHYLGIWKNDNEWYIDISCNFQSESVAVLFGQENLQKAIWDCANNCEIWIERVSNVG